MHGRPRVKDKSEDPARVRAAEQKGALFGQLVEKVLAARRAGAYDPASLELSAKLLELNPEVYTVWNYRREALEATVQGGGEEAVAAIAGELAVTERALMRNPKSYSTWHHRKWAVATGFCSLEHELALVEKLLDADERNFHGWAYRRFVAQLMGMPTQRELDFTRKKIEQNFSNYSAWHYRTALLPALHAAEEGPSDSQTAEAAETAAGMGAGVAATACIPADVLDDELDLVKQAFFTEPEDQSGWFYHRWLLGCAVARYHASLGTAHAAEALSSLLATLDTQLEVCEELLSIEPDAKWPLATQTCLKQLKLEVKSGSKGAAAEGEGESLEATPLAYERLAEIDSMRRGYYMDAAEGKANTIASWASMPKEGAGLQVAQGVTS